MGISLFNGLREYTLEKNIQYIKKASERGYEIVFSSAHIQEAGQAYRDLQTCIDIANEKHMKVSLDISKPAFLQMKSLEGLYALRLDYGFSDQEIVELSQTRDFLIELNASTITSQKFEQLMQMGLNIEHVRMSFNYYPKRHTGHDIAFVRQKVEYFHQYHISVGAFIPSHIGFRPPMYEGLPTIEAHRMCSLDVAIEELKCIGVDEILFGDAYASDQELDILQMHHIEEIAVHFTAVSNLENWYFTYLQNPFSIRIDSNTELLRLHGAKTNIKIFPFHAVKREIGDVTIDNMQFLRYQGEINIVLRPLEQDERVNVIGHIRCSNTVLEKIKEKRMVKFLIDRNDT